MLKLSVVVPFYNVQTYAPDALKSLELNARDDFEFLLVDDRSTDGTSALLERAARELPGASHLRHERNAGLATARNTGLDAARGEYIAFLDGDDWLAPGHLARTLAAIEALSCDFVRTDHVRCTGRARSVQRVPYGPDSVVADPRSAILPAGRTTSVDYPYAWAGMYHRRLLDRGLLHFTDGLRTAEDRPWIWRLHREAESFATVGLPGIFYRRGVSTSLTQIGDERQLDFIRSFDQVLADTAADREFDLLLPKAVRTYCAIIAHHIGSIERFEPAVAKKLRSMSAAALGRMPQDVLDRALDSMDSDRADLLRRLRRRARTADSAASAAAAALGPSPAGVRA
ncbi:MULTISPECIES: glycosyltransferase family 2 protein [unclassified Streptomyces]|uniref:glycosyltransferase family 2 protein n=1 Tax=unclassified Streptomyces TaxID=2593676 RepID=UPI000DC7CDB3|nr:MULTISPECIES: glycosyltransferase family 2 protein [unclassified Streptomyces]AWZ07638.1 glycosyltransferase family 2 protein [Streptomyces sp. ICC4]AWZ11322.1 glycosyltransferase family 2 protein [Streptomyces sp. ICC1]